jgi:hypothetical protein
METTPYRYPTPEECTRICKVCGERFDTVDLRELHEEDCYDS